MARARGLRRLHHEVEGPLDTRVLLDDGQQVAFADHLAMDPPGPLSIRTFSEVSHANLKLAE